MSSSVGIPVGLERTIRDVKEIAGGKHSDDDVYAMLKECQMDPNETAQRLLYLDTFHEVKPKPKPKRHPINRPDVSRRGGAYSSSVISQDSGGRRRGRQENGTSNYRGGTSRTPTTVVQKRDDNAVPPYTSGRKNDGLSYRAVSQVNSGNINGSSKSPNVSDTAVVQPWSAKDPAAVRKIICGNGTLGSAAESESAQNEVKMVTSREVEKNHPTAPEIMNPSSKTVPSPSQAIKSNHLPEPPHEISATITDDTLGVQNNHNSWPAKLGYNLPKGVVSEDETAEPQSTKTSLPIWNNASLDETTQELDQKLQKLSVSSHQPVIFPDHLQVPEALRKGLTFGSLDATLSQSTNSDNVSIMNENSSVTGLVGGETSQSNHHAAPTDKEGDGSLCPPSHPQITGTLTNLGDDELTAGVQKFDQSKHDRFGPAPQMALLHSAPEYGYGIMPPVLTPHITHPEGAEPQASNLAAPSTSGSTPPVTQPSGLGLNSFALPPHLLPYLRQPYPPNLIPYNPYFPHLYMPHAAHQFLGHNMLPQQPTAGGVYASPPAAPGSKYAVPPMLKTSSVGGNMTHFGVPSGYGSFGPSNVGYNSGPAFTSGSSNGTEDLMANELKENNIYPGSLKQNEEAYTWTTTPGRDLSAVPANYFYNIPPGQHVAFPSPHSTHGPPFPGVYHLNQAHSLPSPSSLQSFSQQPQGPGGAIESVVPSSQLPLSQINWNNKLLNKENVGG